MTNEQKSQKLRYIYDAWNAGYITSAECEHQTQAIHKEYFDAKYGKFDIANIPV